MMMIEGRMVDECNNYVTDKLYGGIVQKQHTVTFFQIPSKNKGLS
jgi:hypothetical protein